MDQARHRPAPAEAGPSAPARAQQGGPSVTVVPEVPIGRRRVALVLLPALLLAVLLAALTLRPAPIRVQRPATVAPFPPETQAALQGIVDAHLTAAGAPGAVVGVWVPGHGTRVRAQGVGDVGTGAPITTADTVRIASITKTFTATVVPQLVDEGKLRLDDVLEPHVPGLPNGARITVRQLLGMTSGVFNILEDPAFLAAYEADPLLPFTPQEAIAIARTHPAAFAPGERLHYSETNYLLLGLIVERLTGRSAGEAIEQRIVRPLGLTGTSFPTTPEMPRSFAHGYSPGPNGGPLRDLTRTNPGVPWTAGAMVSNLDDLRVWVKALATGALLSPSTQQERLRMTAIPGGEPVDARYGLGIFSLVGFLGHNGAIAGYSTVAVYLPEEDATIVVLVNTSTLEGGATDAILFDVAGLLFPNRFPPRP